MDLEVNFIFQLNAVATLKNTNTNTMTNIGNYKSIPSLNKEEIKLNDLNLTKKLNPLLKTNLSQNSLLK